MKLLRRSVLLAASWAVLAAAAPSQTGGGTFHDDFESGVLDLAVWATGGRDLSGTGVTDVVSRNGSLQGHVYHASFTEKYINKAFSYSPQLEIEFDAEMRSTDPGSPGWNFYAMAGFSISFYDDSWTYLGGQEYIHATDSGYRASLGSSTFAVFYQPANTPTHYSFTMPQLLANVPGVVEGDVSWVSITFNSYCSWWNSSANGDVWFDNFEVRHIPASLSVAPDPPTAGSLVTFSADGFDPGQACYLGYSVTGLGSTFIPQLGISMDIANARYGSGPVVAATDGTATWTELMPVHAAGRTLWLQAAHSGRSTNVLELVVQ